MYLIFKCISKKIKGLREGRTASVSKNNFEKKKKNSVAIPPVCV